MPGFANSGVIDRKVSKTLVRVALAVGVLIAIFALKYQAKQVLKASPVSEWPARQYGAIRFRDSNTAVGLRSEGSKLVIDQWKPGSNTVKQKILELGDEVPISALRVASDISFVAWTTGRELWVHDMKEESNAVRVPIGGKTALVDVAVLGDGSLVVLFSNGVIERWAAMTQKLLERQTLPLKRPDQIAAAEDYIAAASSSEGKLVIYRQGLLSKLRVVEEVQCPPPPFQLVMAGQGQAALITLGGVVLNGKTLNTPGRVRSLAFGSQSELIVAGDFDGIHAAPKSDETYEVTGAPAGGIIAASEDYLVHTGSSGTRTYTFGTHFQFSDSGRNLLWVAGIFGVVALIAMMDRLMLGIFYRHPSVKTKRARLDVSRSFGDPGEDLLAAARAGELVLWAGSGLSAQCGFPLRRNFAGQLLESGRFEGWLNSADATTLQRLCDSGQHEEAVGALVTERPENRKVVLSLVKAAFRRTVPVSPAHLSLAKIPFASAITTNYDALLEELGVAWGRHLCHPRMRRTRDKVDTSGFFLLKLYGDLFRPHTVLLNRSEAIAELEQPDGLAPIVCDVLARRSVLFIGCSIGALIGDLEKFMPRKPERRHFLLTGVWDPSWKKGAATLARWGIETIPCAEESAYESLPKFLALLAAGVGTPAPTDESMLATSAEVRTTDSDS